MDQTQQITYSVKWRPFLLTLAMCALALLAAWSMEKGIMIFGLVCLLAMGGVFAVIFLTANHPAVMALGASFSVIFLQLLGGFVASLMGVVVLIASLVLSYQIRLRVPKTTALVTASLILGGGFLLIAAVFYVIRGGSLAPSDLLEKYHAYFRELAVKISKQIHENNAAIDEKMLALYAQMGVTREMLLEADLDNMEMALDIAQLVLPGALIFMIQFVAYAQISAFRLTACISHVEALLPAPRWGLIPTQISCVVYTVVSVIYMIGSFLASATSSFMVIMANLWLVLLPTMLLCGVRVLLMRLRHPMYRMSTGLVVTIFVFGLFFLPSVALMFATFLLAFLGAQTMFNMHMMAAEKNKKQ